MAVQDDGREQEMVRLFGLRALGERSGTDAELDLDGRRVAFELKSTTSGNGSVSTARDIGPDHIKRWRSHHWLVGFYTRDQQLRYTVYAPPAKMGPWIDRIEAKIRPDLQLSQLAPDRLTIADLYAIIGTKKTYTLADARNIAKSQKGHGCQAYDAARYRALMDVADGYTPGRMLEILRDRCHYLISRGSTLNNEHIPGNYFAECEQITRSHAARLRQLVAEAIAAEPRRRP